MHGRFHGSTPWRVVVVFLAIVATVVGLAPSASAAYAPEPVGPSWVPNGGVHAVVVDTAANRVYVGGSFTGGVAALTADTGALVWTGNANADVRALALNGGQLLIGGAFSTVGGVTHRGIASVSASTGAVNPTFKGAAGGTVRDIVVDNGIAYFGGAFVNHGGMAQQGLGAVDASTGALVSTFTPATNGPVYALGVTGGRLYFGGNFTTVNGQPRNQLASVTLLSGTLDAWVVGKPCSGCNVVWDLALDPGRNRVYTVGRNAGTLFTADLTTGTTVFRNVGAVNGDSQAVTLAPDGRVYVGGHFVTVQGQPRMLVAEFDVSARTPVLGAFSTRFVTSYPGVWALAATDRGLYVGGDFTAAGSKVNNQNRYPYFAMFPVAAAPDKTAPTVTGTSPTANATGVLASTDVTATFSEPVQGVDATTFTLTPAAGGTAVGASVAPGTSPDQWVLNPTADLAASTLYTARLTGSTTAIRDTAGNPLASMSWSFITAAAPADSTPPSVSATTPTAGATAVPVANDVTATFSEPVQGVGPTTFTLTPAGGTTPVDAGVTPGTGNQWILNPSADLAPGTQYTAALTSGATAIRDLANIPLASMSWTFTTTAAAAPPADTTPPTWTGRIPSADGATGFSRTANVTIAFNEEVTNVNTTTFSLAPIDAAGQPGPAVMATVTFNSTNGRWVLNPSVTLAATTRYRATVTSDVTDLAGNHFAGVTWSFTTGA